MKDESPNAERPSASDTIQKIARLTGTAATDSDRQVCLQYGRHGNFHCFAL
jgi:hypothetical protein